MYLYNTMSRKKEELLPQQGKQVNIYACGPTVYNFIHIGNARPICAFDVLRRYLTWRGYTVKYVQNFTDVDDKIIKRANEEGSSAAQVAEKYIAEYKTDAHGLNVMDADVHPQVTTCMQDIIDFVKALVDSGHAYEADGDVYFRTASFPEYGKLSKNSMEDLQAGARIGVDERKESALDIHCGGQDLIFPHHENEIAQSESVTGKPLANLWMHNGYINVDNKKMSKSLGNFFTAREVAEKYGYEVVRYMMVQAHYRSPINYCVELLDACKASLERLYTCRDTLDRAIANAPAGAADPDSLALFDQRKQAFITAMDDDLNTADGVSVLFDLVRDLNTRSNDPATTKDTLTAGAKLFDELTGVLGLLYNRKQGNEIPAQVQELVDARTAARKAKDFAEADRLRDEIAALGYAVKETRQGVEITKL